MATQRFGAGCVTSWSLRNGLTKAQSEEMLMILDKNAVRSIGVPSGEAII